MIGPSVYLLAISILFILCPCSGEYKHDDFSYQDVSHWSSKFVECGGTRQSPINIDTGNTVETRFSPALDLKEYNKQISSVKIINDGHTVKVAFQGTTIAVRGGPLMSDTFVLDSFHFHFGKNNNGSEHTVNRFRYAMEVHFVHLNVKYANIVEAVKHTDGALVIAVFVKLDSRNVHAKRLSFITNNLGRITKAENEYRVSGPIYLSSLIPYLDKGYGYWTYKGSLTTPLCQESVLWIVSDKPLLLDDTEIRKFNALTNEDGISCAGNNRYLQPLRGRIVRHVPAI